MRKMLTTLLIVSITFVLLPIGHIGSAQSQDGDNGSTEVPENTTSDLGAGDVCTLACCLVDLLGILGVVSLTMRKNSLPVFVHNSNE